MKPKSFFLALPVACALLQSAHGQTLLFTDHFNTFDGWTPPGVTADQGGLHAGTSYITNTPNAGWISHSSDADQPFGNNTLKVDTGGAQTFVKLDRNFATDANAENLPLSISFYARANGGPATNWAAFTLGTNANAFITDSTNKFGTLFRNSSNDTQQFNAGNNLATQGSVSYSQATGSVITLVFTDTAGTGSAFNNNGSKVAFYVDNVLVQEFTLSQLTANDGYLGFQTYGTRGIFDNLRVETVNPSVTPPPSEQAGSWTSNTDGNWADSANWLDGAIANGSGQTATFNQTSTVAVAVNPARTIGHLVVDVADTTINGPAGLTLSSTTETPSISVGASNAARIATIAAPITAPSGFVKTGNGTLSLRRPISSPGAVTIQGGTLEMIQTLNGTSADYNWWAGVASTEVQAGAKLTTNSHTALLNLTLSGGELASSGVDPFYGYGSWSLQGDACTVSGAGTSTISAQEVDCNTLTNGFVVEAGATLQITGSLKNGTLIKRGSGSMVLAAPRLGADDAIVNDGTLEVANTGSIRFRPTANGSCNVVRGSATASLTYHGAINLDLSGAALADGNTWTLIDEASFSTPGAVTYGNDFSVTSNLGSFTQTTAGIWQLAVTNATWTYTQSSGALSYSITATPFELWASNLGLTGGLTDDDDGDGVTNFQEFAFGLNPTSAASANPITTQLDPAVGTLSYSRRKTSLTGLSYRVETSTDLSTWTTDTAATQSATEVPSSDNEIVQVTLSATAPLSAPKLFVRLVATAP